jgi:hypothetical protein
MQESIDWDAKTLVEGELEAGKPKATVKDGKMLVTGKIRCLACPTVLTNKCLAPEKYETSCGSLYRAI